MTDDEVMQWLSTEERNAFYSLASMERGVFDNPGVDTTLYRGGAVMIAALRSLAETRKALAVAKIAWGDGAATESERDWLDGVFTTMPRPR